MFLYTFNFLTKNNDIGIDPRTFIFAVEEIGLNWTLFGEISNCSKMM